MVLAVPKGNPADIRSFEELGTKWNGEAPVIPVRQLFETPVSKAAALLSGCKNYSRAREAGEGQVYAEDWHVTLRYEGVKPAGFCHVGIRSHYLCPVSEEEAKRQENVFRCRIEKVIEDVFSMVLMVRPVAAVNPDMDSHEGRIRVELSKECWDMFCRKEDVSGDILIHVEPKDVMLLCNMAV